MKKSIYFSSLFCLLIGASGIQADGIYINFNDNNDNPTNYAAAAEQSGAWQAIDTLGTTNNLIDIAGNPTSASLDLTASTATGHGGGTATTDAERILRGNFYSTDGNPWSLTLSGLSTNADFFNVYYYAPHNAMPTGSFTINGTNINSIPGSIGTLVEGTSYGVLSNLLPTNTLVLTSTSSSGFRGLAALQIEMVIPAPAPVSLFLLGLLGLALVKTSRNRQGTM